MGLKTTNVIEVANHFAKKPVVISIPGHAPISVTDDMATMNAVKEKLSYLAATRPAPMVTIQAPRDADISRIRATARLVRASGLTRINFALGQTNK